MHLHDAGFYFNFSICETHFENKNNEFLKLKKRSYLFIQAKI